MARTLAPVCVMLSASTLAAGALVAAGFEAEGLSLQIRWLWASVVALVGVFWLLGYWRGLEWVASVGLVGLAAAAAIGLLLGLGAGWMVFGLVAALCAWDLHRFVLCLNSVEQVEREGLLERRHLQRLLLVAALGSLLAVLALEIEVRLTFLMALLLGLLAAWGLSRAVGFLRRESD